MDAQFLPALPFLTELLFHTIVEIDARLLATVYVQRANNNETVKAARLQLVCGAVPVYTRPGAAPTTPLPFVALSFVALSSHADAASGPSPTPPSQKRNDGGHIIGPGGRISKAATIHTNEPKGTTSPYRMNIKCSTRITR
jgi:hypothetical protein